MTYPPDWYSNDDRDWETTCGTEDPAEACPRCRVVFSSSQLMALHYAHTHGESQ